MKRIVTLIGLALVIQMAVFAQDWSSPATLKKLSEKAEKSVDVNLDQAMLQFAGAFLNVKDPDQAQAKKLIANLKGIYVHSFHFDKAGEYSEEDVSSLRSPLKESEWSRIVNVRGKRDGENVEVYFKKEGGKFTGLVVIAAQPTELTFVSIAGPINPEDLAKLGGQFGIPPLQMNHAAGPPSAKKEDSQ